MNIFRLHPRFVFVFGLSCSVALFAQTGTVKHDAEKPVEAGGLEAGAVEAPKKVFFNVERDPDGSIVRNFADEKNLNGKRETLVNWNECDNSGGFTAQVTWSYDPMKREAAYPQKAEDMVPCTKRPISEDFVNFLNDNMKFCIAAASLPSTHIFIDQQMLEIKKKYGKNFKKEAGENGLVVDTTLAAKLTPFFLKNDALIQKELAAISEVKLLHQGIIGDERHSKHSYHSKLAMRAIDMSHLRVTRSTKDKDGKVTSDTTLYQHNVATFAENQELAGKGKKLTPEQNNQHSFWQAYGACIQSKGGSVISNCLHHTGAGLKHQGHMHVSLPYVPPGSYGTK